MNYLLDTNVVSEWVKPQPDANVVDWMFRVDEDRVFLSVVSIAELRQGIELLAPSARRTRLFTWLQTELEPRFEGRVLPVDLAVAHSWGVLSTRAKKSGISLSDMDAFFAATAAVYNLTLVTRNVRDFEKLAIQLLNPWKSS